MEKQQIVTNNFPSSARLAKLIRIAHLVRRQFEANYPEEKTFRGYCGLASYRLVLTANYNNLYPTLVYGDYLEDNHVWIEYAGKIIDITATQFGVEDRVHVVTKDDPRYISWRYSKRPEIIEEMLYWCKFHMTPDYFEKAKVLI